MNEELLVAYVESFYGYGSWNAPVWFIGPEEGGGGNRAEIEQGNYASAQVELCCRVEHWNAQRQAQAQGTPHLLNIQEVPVAQPWFGVNVGRRQKTWARLIMVLSGIQHIDQAHTAEYRQAQRSAWGSAGCDACDLSLFPLPSPRRRFWAYGHFLGLPQFAERRIYETAHLGPRACFLRHQIALRAKASPLTVVFYGSHRPWWTLIAGAVGVPQDELHVWDYGHDLPQARFFGIPHPDARGLGDHDFHSIGENLMN